MLGSVRERREWYADNMQRGFDALADLYYAYWGESFHLALYEPGDDPADFEGALEKTHELYFNALNASSAGRVLDLCCGGGAFTSWVAARTPATVVGVDLSRRQLNHARQRLVRQPRPNLRFVQHDAMHVADLDEPPFDAAVCLDAACYLPDRAVALQGVASRLNPGARILVVDWCQGTVPTRLQQDLILEPFYRAWGIPTMESAEGYQRAFRDAGLRVLDLIDLSDRVGPNWERAYRLALTALAEPVRPLQLLRMVARYGPGAVQLAKEQFTVALLARAAADSGLLRYLYVLGERPSA